MNTVKLSEKKAQQTLLSEIDLGDNTFCMSYLFDINGLVDSIRRFGLINSPILVKTGQGRFIVVMGYRRLLAARALGWKRVPCRVFNENQISGEAWLVSGLHENLFTRRFNEVEKGMILAKLSNCLSMERIQKEFMPLLSMPANRKTLNLYLAMEHDLETEMKEVIAQDHLSMSTVAQLLEMSTEDRACVFHLLSNLKLNFNQQKYILEYINDISNSEKIEIKDICAEKGLVEIICNPNMNNPQKSSAVLMNLKARVFPRLTLAEETFKKAVKDLKLPHGVKISSPAFFESPDFRMEIQFQDGEELQKRVKILSDNRGLRGLQNPCDRKN